MRHITFDLETLAATADALIIQLAAVEFDETGKSIAEFDKLVDFTHLDDKFTTTEDTINWWAQQSKEAKEKVFSPDNRCQLSSILEDFNKFLGNRECKLWSHATFDVPILMNAYRVMSIKPRFHYTACLDIRTLNFLSGDVVVKREDFGAAHDAIADCKYQAAYISKMLSNVNASRTPK